VIVIYFIFAIIIKEKIIFLKQQQIMKIKLLFTIIFLCGTSFPLFSMEKENPSTKAAEPKNALVQLCSESIDSAKQVLSSVITTFSKILLMHAAAQCNLRLIRFFLNHGTEINFSDMHYIVEYLPPDVVSLFIMYGNRVDSETLSDVLTNHYEWTAALGDTVFYKLLLALTRMKFILPKH
jgi:hypothetical protein